MQSKPPVRKYRNYWKGRNPNSRKQGQSQKSWYRFVSEKINEGDTVLDMGCGAARQHHFLMERKPLKLVGTDVCQKALDAAVRLGDNHYFVHMEDKDSLDDSYDIVIAMDVIEHVMEDIDFLDFCFNKAKKMLFLTTPNLNGHHYIGRFHCREYTPPEFEDLIRKHCVAREISFLAWELQDRRAYRTDNIYSAGTFNNDSMNPKIDAIGALIIK